MIQATDNLYFNIWNKLTVVKDEKNKTFERYKALLLSRYYSENAEVAEDKIYLTIKGEVIGTAGNFVVFTGLPKVGKSTILASMIASGFTDSEVLGMKLDLSGTKNRIGYFDTEQSPYSFKRQLQKIKRYTDNSPKVSNSIDYFLFREDCSRDILLMISAYLKIESKCGVIVIDGLLDLIENMNDESESKRLIRILKKWGKEYGILIVTVLHVGKRDFQSIGHLGSMTDRYSQSTLLIEKENDGSFTLKGKMLRDSVGFNDLNCVYNHAAQCFVENEFYTDAKLIIQKAKR